MGWEKTVRTRESFHFLSDEKKKLQESLQIITLKKLNVSVSRHIHV